MTTGPSSTAAFRETLLNATAIIYPRDGQSGIHMGQVLERLGIAEQMRPRITLRATAGPVAENVVRGEADLGFQSITEILSVQGAELLGPLPAELQSYTVLCASTAPGTTAPTLAVLIFLATPAAKQAMLQHGVEPLPR